MRCQCGREWGPMEWDHLRRTYKKHGIVLVLGAGVSIGSGLPSWSGLLERVADGLGGEENEGLVPDLRSGGVPLPVIASILEERCGTRTESIKRVRGALYRDFPFFPAGITRANREELIQHVRVK